MLGLFKTLMRSRSARVQEEHVNHQLQRSKGLPLGMTPDDFAGMRLGGTVSFDLLAIKAFQGLRFDASWSDAPQHIAAIGLIELGHGEQLVRFYLDNDTWVQASVANQLVFEYKLFDFIDSEDLADTELDRQINQPTDDADTTAIGHARYVLAGNERHDATTFHRVWGDNEASWSPPVLLQEHVIQSSDPNGAGFTVDHHCMLYERYEEESERYEVIYLSAEANPAERSYQRVTSLGVDIRSLIIDAH